MGEQDIDQLQSFGAKITQKNQEKPSPINLNNKSKKVKIEKKEKINQSVKINIGIQKKKVKHFIRKLKIKSKAFFSPYIIKIQTQSSYQLHNSPKKYIKRKRLIEKRKMIGNTIIVIRRWKKVRLPVDQKIPGNIQHVYYFHQKKQNKKKFQPRKSIWDVPIIFNKK